MRKERKIELMHSFPSVPYEIQEKMKGKGTENYAVLLTYGDELFVRCYHRYSKGEIVERQRYVFAKDGFCRYGSNYGKEWKILTEFREPVFCLSCYGYNFDNSYSVLNIEAIKKSWMKYSEAEKYAGNLLMGYMKLYCKHPNVEYLVKSGYYSLIHEHVSGYWGGKITLETDPHINWKSNNLLKMLGLNRTEFSVLKGSEGYYDRYIQWRELYPKYKPQDLLALAKVFGYERGTLEMFCMRTGLKPLRLARYLNENNLYTCDYKDYLDQCRELQYNMHDTAVCMPKDFHTMHERLSAILEYKQNEEIRKAFIQNYESRKELEYSSNGLIIRQPASFDEITVEGAVLNHCVGGYAERHALGKLHILFIRTETKPDVPYYTMEVDTSGKIIQCRGYGNNRTVPKPQEIFDFEIEYQKYLDKVFKRKNKKEKKTA